MQFGRQDDTTDLDPELPPWDVRRPSTPATLSVRVGGPSWTEGFDHLPKGPKRLPAYAERYNCIELNATFYAVPGLATVKRWREVVPPAFRFCVKVPRSISHGGADWAREVSAFRALLDELGPALGPWFFQAPPEAAPSDLPELQRRLQALQANYPFPGALEVRHAGWFADGALIPALSDWMADMGLSAVVSDTPGRRDALHATRSTSTAFIRLLADAGHPSTGPRVAAWVEQLRAGAEMGLSDAWIFLHQPEKQRLPELITMMETALGDLCLTGGGERQARLFG